MSLQPLNPARNAICQPTLPDSVHASKAEKAESSQPGRFCQPNDRDEAERDRAVRHTLALLAAAGLDTTEQALVAAVVGRADGAPTVQATQNEIADAARVSRSTMRFLTPVLARLKRIGLPFVEQTGRSTFVVAAIFRELRAELAALDLDPATTTARAIELVERHRRAKGLRVPVTPASRRRRAAVGIYDNPSEAASRRYDKAQHERLDLTKEAKARAMLAFADALRDRALRDLDPAECVRRAHSHIPECAVSEDKESKQLAHSPATTDVDVSVSFDSFPKEKEEKPTPTPTDPDDELIGRAARATNGRKFGRLLDGDATGYRDRTAALLGWLRMLDYWTDHDGPRAQRLAARSPLATGATPAWVRERLEGYGCTFPAADDTKHVEPTKNAATVSSVARPHVERPPEAPEVWLTRFPFDLLTNNGHGHFRRSEAMVELTGRRGLDVATARALVDAELDRLERKLWRNGRAADVHRANAAQWHTGDDLDDCPRCARLVAN